MCRSSLIGHGPLLTLPSTSYTTTLDPETVTAPDASTVTTTNTIYDVVTVAQKVKRAALSSEESKWFQAAKDENKHPHLSHPGTSSTLQRRDAGEDASVASALSSACTCLRVQQSTTNVVATASPSVRFILSG